jgi:hypothetical protein
MSDIKIVTFNKLPQYTQVVQEPILPKKSVRVQSVDDTTMLLLCMIRQNTKI